MEKEQITEKSTIVAFDYFQDIFKSNIKNSEKVFKIITDFNNVDKVKENGWHVIDTVMDFLKSSDVSQSEFQVYMDIISKVAEITPPKEVYLGILEHFDPHVELVLVMNLLPPLGIVFERLSKEDIKSCLLSFDMAYTALYYYIDSLNIPEYKAYEPVNSNSMEHEAVNIFEIILKVLSVLSNPLETVLKSSEHFQKSDLKSSYDTFIKESFRFFCNLLSTLNKLDLDLHVDETTPTKSPSESDTMDTENIPNVKQLFVSLFSLIHSFYSPTVLITNQYWIGRFYTYRSDDEDAQEDEIKQSENARACYLYLLYCNNISAALRPKIWSYEYLLGLCMKDVVCLLSQKSPVIVHKGLELCRAIVNQLNVKALSYEKISMLEPSITVNAHVENTFEENGVEETKEANKNIVKQMYINMIAVAIFVPSKLIRERAVDFLVKFTEKFTYNDRYIIVKYLLNNAKHSGVAGVVIHYVKEKVDQELNGKAEMVFSKPSKLKDLLKSITHLPNGTETDILVYSDKIMPALNLLRYLLIRDKDNITQITELHDEINTEFLKPLRTGLNLSRAHYEAELKHCHKKKSSVHGNKNSDSDFTINGLPLPNLPLAQQKQTLSTALASFDMMEIVLARVEELFSDSIKI